MKINDKHISGVKYIMNKLNKKKINISIETKNR
jgi:hypothetical protein